MIFSAAIARALHPFSKSNDKQEQLAIHILHGTYGLLHLIRMRAAQLLGARYSARSSLALSQWTAMKCAGAGNGALHLEFACPI